MSFQKYVGRVALVTGASKGIGAAIAQTLQKKGLIVVGIGRDVEKIEELDIPEAPGKLHAYECDITEEEDIMEAFEWIQENLGYVDILINTARIRSKTNLVEAETSEWKNILELNVIGLSILTREVVKSMRERGIEDGYIIHINSVAAHSPPTSSSLAMYYATKNAVKVLSEGLRRDLAMSQSKIRNTTISLGTVKVEECPDDKKCLKGVSNKVPFMEPEDVAEFVIFILSRPPRVQIQDIIIYDTGTTIY